MAANNRDPEGGARLRTYPVSLQQAAAAIFGTTPLREQSAVVPRRSSTSFKTDRENQ